jgi:hypothetical protein
MWWGRKRRSDSARHAYDTRVRSGGYLPGRKLLGEARVLLLETCDCDAATGGTAQEGQRVPDTAQAQPPLLVDGHRDGCRGGPVLECADQPAQPGVARPRSSRRRGPTAPRPRCRQPVDRRTSASPSFSRGRQRYRVWSLPRWCPAPRVRRRAGAPRRPRRETALGSSRAGPPALLRAATIRRPPWPPTAYDPEQRGVEQVEIPSWARLGRVVERRAHELVLSVRPGATASAARGSRVGRPTALLCTAS